MAAFPDVADLLEGHCEGSGLVGHRGSCELFHSDSPVVFVVVFVVVGIRPLVAVKVLLLLVLLLSLVLEVIMVGTMVSWLVVVYVGVV